MTPAEHHERGSLSVFAIGIAVSLLVIIGLAVDGGTQVRNLQRADTAAQEAARAAGQAINAPTALRGNGTVIDPSAARAAATGYLAAAGIPGEVTLSTPTTLHVHTTTTAPTTFVSLIGIDTVTASGDANVELIRTLGGARS